MTLTITSAAFLEAEGYFVAYIEQLGEWLPVADPKTIENVPVRHWRDKAAFLQFNNMCPNTPRNHQQAIVERRPRAGAWQYPVNLRWELIQWLLTP
jgi:hypothetical protein